MANESGTVRNASTILLMRDAPIPTGGESAIEIFMMVRNYQIEFASGALVFPGGSVDAGDAIVAARPEFYRANPGVTIDLTFQVAAVRETFEESGILLARNRGSADLISASEAAKIGEAHRVALCEGKISFVEVLDINRLELALDLMVPYAHWITPVGMPKRFDTWFFLVAAPPEQVGVHDGKESTDSIWISAAEAVEGGASGRFTLLFPTVRNLIRLSKQSNVADALAHARDMEIVTVTPILTRDGDKRQLRIPAEAGYDGELFNVG